MNGKDLIAFSLWVNDKMYNSRLKTASNDLVSYYIENKDRIRNQYLNITDVK